MIGRISLLLVALAVLATTAIDARRWSTRAPGSSRDWKLVGPAPFTTRHSVILALKENNMDQLETLFRDIHDPNHPSWLQHMTPQQIHDISALPSHHTDAMIEWLVTGGVDASTIEYGLASGAIQFTASVGTINSLFNTTMAVYQHTKHRTKALAHSGDCHLPDQFHGLIEFADGLHFLPFHLQRHGQILEYHQYSKFAIGGAPNTGTSNDTTSANVARKLLQFSSFQPIFPVNSLYSWYNAPDQASYTKAKSAPWPNSNLDVVQFWTSDGQGGTVQNSFSPDDLTIYSYLWSNSQNTDTLRADHVIGPNNANSPQGEPSLDIQSATSWNPRTSAVFENQEQSSNQMYAWATRFLGRQNIPQVASLSYGLAEVVFITGGSSTVDGIPANQYLDRTNTQFMKIGLRGTTIVVSSGDDGANEANPTCDYTQNFDYYGYGLLADFPASSPYVTAVGATAILDISDSHYSPTMAGGALMCNNFDTTKFSGYGITRPSTTTYYRCFQSAGAVTRSQVTEAACSLDNSIIISGGGFSRQYPLPTWQAAVVNTYVTSHSSILPASTYFDATKRGIPDVSMYGNFIPTIVGKQFQLVAGTSLAAPLFAAVIAQLNAITRAGANQTIGFANPLLYDMRANQSNTFTDITAGNNICPRNRQFNSDQDCINAGCQGFHAAAGWDAVTGLGVPNVNNMISYVTQLVNSGRFSGGTDTGSTSDVSDNGAASVTQSAAALAATALVSLCLFIF